MWLKVIEILIPVIAVIINIIYLYFDKRKLSRELEKYKSELNRINERHSVQFSYLHRERAKVLRELYRLITRLHESMRSWITPLYLPDEQGVCHKKEDDKKRIEEVGKYLNELTNTYRDNKLLLAQELQDKIDPSIKDLTSFCIIYKTKKDISESSFSKEERIKWLTESEEYQSRLDCLKDIISNLEKEFQKLLAV